LLIGLLTDWPHVVVAEAPPKGFEVNSLPGEASSAVEHRYGSAQKVWLPVVHIALARIITKNPVDHNLLFVLTKNSWVQ
jgi:hypothetical protein